MAAAEEIYLCLEKLGIEVLFDDREERPGVKFKDNDLIGIPIRIVVGSKGLAEGNVEVKIRSSGEVLVLSLGDVVSIVTQRIGSALAAHR
jgi:prolyl-tRNA synthetase